MLAGLLCDLIGANRWDLLPCAVEAAELSGVHPILDDRAVDERVSVILNCAAVSRPSATTHARNCVMSKPL